MVLSPPERKMFFFFNLTRILLLFQIYIQKIYGDLPINGDQFVDAHVG